MIIIRKFQEVYGYIVDMLFNIVDFTDDNATDSFNFKQRVVGQ